MRRRFKAISDPISRHAGLLLALAGLVVSFVAIALFFGEIHLYFQPLPINFAGLIVYSIPFGGAVILAVVTACALPTHAVLNRQFHNSIDLAGKDEVTLRSQVVVSVLLCLGYYIVISIVPIESVAASIPLGELIKPLLPSGSNLASYVVPLIIALSGPAGPATLRVVRYLHKTKTELIETSKTIAMLQGFCYLSWIAFCLWSAQRNSWLDHDFWGGFFLFVLPGALAGLALMRCRGGEPGVDIRA